MGDPIGRLRRRIAIAAPVDTPDGAGGVTRTWATADTVWAAIEPLGAGFRFAAGQAGQTVTHRITMRAGPDLTVRHRLTDGTRTYEIRSVHTADAEARFLVALTEEMTG